MIETTIHPNLVSPIVGLIAENYSVGLNYAMIDYEEHDGQLEIKDGRLYVYKEVANHTNKQLEGLLIKLGEKAWGKDILTPNSNVNGQLYIKAVELGCWVRDMEVAAIDKNIEEMAARFNELPSVFALIACKQITPQKLSKVYEHKEMKKFGDNLLRIILGVNVE